LSREGVKTLWFLSPPLYRRLSHGHLHGRIAPPVFASELAHTRLETGLEPFHFRARDRFRDTLGPSTYFAFVW